MATDTVQMGDLPPSEPQSQGGGEMTLIEHLLGSDAYDSRIP